MERCIDRLKVAIGSIDPPLKVAQSRLKKRLRRPDVELCNDEPHIHLTNQVKELMEMIRQLENKLADSNTSLADLMKNKERLEQNIRVKKNSLLIDQQKCMALRKHFPFFIVSTIRDPFF
jgi:hypothetical protein